jgi:hypothetical protein
MVLLKIKRNGNVTCRICIAIQPKSWKAVKVAEPCQRSGGIQLQLKCSVSLGHLEK